jgi:alpha-D-ribose 1-methylphosphonate 5-triphosphate synthase subunit PhnH
MSGFSFEGMSDLKKRTGGSRGNNAVAFNLPFRISQVHVANTKAATRGVDTVEGFLIKEAFGLAIGDLVTIRIKDRGIPADPDKTPMEVFDLQIGRKKGSGGKMGTHAAVVAEDARMVEGNVIECNWVKVVEHEFKETPDDEWLHSGFVSVGYLNAPTDSGFIRQDRFVHFPEYAKVIEGQGEEALASFKATVSALLAERNADAGGRPSVVLRLVNQAQVSQPGSVATATIWLGWDKDAGTFLSPEESVDRWLSNPENANWLNFVQHAEQIGASNGVLEVWPVWSFTTAKNTAERETKLKKAGKMHLQEQFTAPMINEAGDPVTNDNGGRRNHYGLITQGMHQVVKMQGGTDWFANMSWTLDRFPTKLYSIDDLPTANLSPEVTAVFEAQGTKRVEDKKAARNQSRENDAAPEQEQGQEFGSEAAPDPAGGQAFRPRG